MMFWHIHSAIKPKVALLIGRSLHLLGVSIIQRLLSLHEPEDRPAISHLKPFSSLLRKPITLPTTLHGGLYYRSGNVNTQCSFVTISSHQAECLASLPPYYTPIVGQLTCLARKKFSLQHSC